MSTIKRFRGIMLLPRKIILIAFVAVSVCLPSCRSKKKKKADRPRPRGPTAQQLKQRQFETAKRFFGYLVDGRYEEAATRVDGRMKKVLPAQRIKLLWEGVNRNLGEFTGVEEHKILWKAGFATAEFAVRFRQATISVRVVVNKQNRVAGLIFAPPAPWLAYKPPQYANPSRFSERKVKVGRAEWLLPGKVSVPHSCRKAPCPAVVLVHGSGPRDRNERTGPNRPFKDIAWGLAASGVAVLRYDKRTLVHGARMSGPNQKWTVDEETINDALSAISLLRKTRGVDPKRIALLGHGLGGYLAPRIASRDSALSGLVILAGHTRAFDLVMLEKAAYLQTLGGDRAKEAAQKAADLEKTAARIRAANLRPYTDPELLAGRPATYWLDLRNYDPLAAARELTLPILILHGERDYEVTAKDLNGWKTGLGRSKGLTVRTYPKLNHLFMTGEGKPGPDDYRKPGHVHESVIRDIARFVKNLPPAGTDPAKPSPR